MMPAVLSRAQLSTASAYTKQVNFFQGFAMFNNISPRYVHDCACCTFLGFHAESDLYVCTSRQLTVIARKSSAPADYVSGLGSSFGSHDALTQARLRAQSRGLVDYDLDLALQSVRADADDAVKAELETELLNSKVGRVLALLANNRELGMCAAADFLAAAVKVAAEKSPSRDLELLKDLCVGQLTSACAWLKRLGHSHPDSRTMALAMYSDS